MKSCVIVSLIVMSICASASPAVAQPLPPGVPSAPRVPGVEGTPAGGDVEDAQRRADRDDPASWRVSLGFGEGYESDVSFSGADGNGDWGRSLQAGLAHTWMTRRGTVELSGDGAHTSYHQASDVNRFTYGINAGASYALTRRLNWRFGGAFSQMYSHDAPIFTEAAEVFPRVMTRSGGTYSELGYALTSKNQLNLNVSTMRVSFEDSELVPGSSLVARFAFSRQLNRTHSLGVSIGHTISTITGDIQGLLATWQARVGSTLTLNATGGIRPYKLDGQSQSYSFAPGGSVGLAFAFSRNQTAAVTYEHAVEQAFGYGGTHLAHRYNAFYGLAVGRRLTLDGSASLGINSYPQQPDYHNSGKTLYTGARYMVLPQLSIGAGYGLWVREATGEPSTTTYRVTLSATYGLAWR